jgi:hypothetical protein
MHVGGFEEVGDEAIDWEAAFELLAEDFEARQGFGERQEPGSVAHGYGFGVGFDGFIGDVYISSSV